MKTNRDLLLIFFHDFFVAKVVSGDKHDIDLIVEGPTTHIIYQGHRKEFDSVEFNATVSKKKQFETKSEEQKQGIQVDAKISIRNVSIQQKFISTICDPAQS